MPTKETGLSYIVAWIQCRTGATAIEYGLIAGGISMGILAAVLAFGGALGDVYSTLTSGFQQLVGNGNP